MATNQLAIKRLVRANLIPKLYRFSWQTFWGLFPFNFFFFFKVISSFEWSPWVSYWHVWRPSPSSLILSQTTQPDTVLSSPFLCSLSPHSTSCHLIYRRYILVDWFSPLPMRDFVSNFSACMNFWVFISWLVRAFKLSWKGKAGHEEFCQHAIWKTLGSVP